MKTRFEKKKQSNGNTLRRDKFFIHNHMICVRVFLGVFSYVVLENTRGFNLRRTKGALVEGLGTERYAFFGPRWFRDAPNVNSTRSDV